MQESYPNRQVPGHRMCSNFHRRLRETWRFSVSRVDGGAKDGYTANIYNQIMEIISSCPSATSRRYLSIICIILAMRDLNSSQFDPTHQWKCELYLKIILFLIFINDIVDRISCPISMPATNDNINDVLIYANDTMIYAIAKTQPLLLQSIDFWWKQSTIKQCRPTLVCLNWSFVLRVRSIRLKGSSKICSTSYFIDMRKKRCHYVHSTLSPRVFYVAGTCISRCHLVYSTLPVRVFTLSPPVFYVAGTCSSRSHYVYSTLSLRLPSGNTARMLSNSLTVGKNVVIGQFDALHHLSFLQPLRFSVLNVFNDYTSVSDLNRSIHV
ncbi:hypothetical protein GQR58_023986 [Nymphon striatum]|nr:hypothetical protein GQR58_023986 [Nymphon striatum]